MDKTTVVLHERKMERDRREALNKFLGLEDQRINCIKKTFPHFMNGAVYRAFNMLFKEKYRSSNEPKILPFSEVVRSDKTEEKGTGCYFLEGPAGEKFVVEPVFNKEFIRSSFVVMFAEKNLKWGQTFLGELEKKAKSFKGCIFKDDGTIFELEKEYTWNDIILPEPVKNMLLENVVNFKGQRDFFVKHGIPYKRGLLLYGAPGNGKTLAAKIIASLSGLNVIWLTAGQNMGYGRNNISDIYDFARDMVPALILFEDIDLFSGDRRYDEGGMLGELLNQMDGLEVNDGVVTMATTNDVTLLDKALAARPGRFDIKIHFDNPTEDARKELLIRMLKDAVLEAPLSVDYFVRKTKDYSCAQVKEVAYRCMISSGRQEPAVSDGKLIIRESHAAHALDFVEAQHKAIGFSEAQGKVRVEA